MDKESNTDIELARPKVVVLLTATIDPRNTVKVARNDPWQRLEDYKKAMSKCWLSENRPIDIIFCENSNCNLSELRRLCERNSKSNVRIEFLSFSGQECSSHLGKGFGEMGIIAHALQHATVLRRGNPLILKVSGRLVIGNIGSLLAALQEMSGTFHISCDLRRNLEWADARLFIARASFLRDYLVPMQQMIDDSKGLTIEHILCRATHKAIGDGLKWIPTICTPQIFGVSGTTGIPYSESFAHWAALDLFRRMKNWTIAR